MKRSHHGVRINKYLIREPMNKVTKYDGLIEWKVRETVGIREQRTKII